jgi:hypothetical protein
MSTPDIIKKLKKELDRGIASEARAVYLLTEVRKLIERDKAKGAYPNLKFHCDWVLHAKLTGPGAQDILRQFDAAHPLLRDQKLRLHDLPLVLRGEINRISKMKSFREELDLLLADYGLPPLKRGWTHFLHVYAKIVEDIPLEVTGNNAQHISKVVVHFEKAKKKLHGETLYKVTWSIHDKNGQHGSIEIYNSFA